MRHLTRVLIPALLAVMLLLVTAATAGAQGQSYVVQPGDTLFKIAVRFGVTMDAIRAANGITGDRIYYGQTLTIPDPNAPAQPPPATGGEVIHVVQPGETLFSIGLKYNMVWTKIQAANGLAGTTVYSGQRLVIPVSGTTTTPPNNPPPTQPPPDPAPTQPPAENPPPQGGQVIHVVQAGETLHKIGVRYGIAWPVIARANNIAGDRIYTGQKLVIPLDGNSGSPASPPPPPATNGGGKRFLIDLSDQMLYAYEGDTLVRSVLVSTGTARTPTVTGTYYIYARYESTRMRGPGYDLPNVPFTQYFYKGYGLHGTYWHNNFGTPMSHGCVNMPTPEAEWAFYWADYGTPVIVQP